jgi:excisionase family DNA binding protein
MSLTVKTPAQSYVDAGAVAEMLHVSRETVLAWVRQGKLPSIRPAGQRPVLFDLDAVKQAVEERSKSPEVANGV